MLKNIAGEMMNSAVTVPQQFKQTSQNCLASNVGNILHDFCMCREEVHDNDIKTKVALQRTVTCSCLF